MDKPVVGEGIGDWLSVSDDFFPCIPNVYLVAKIIDTQVFMLYRRTNLFNKIYIREHHARKNPHTA